MSRRTQYPEKGLRTALHLLAQALDNAPDWPAERAEVMRAMGYRGDSGASYGAFGSLLAYGLLQEAAGKRYAVSEVGTALLGMRPENPRCQDFIERAAWTPPLFRQLRDRYGPHLPDFAQVQEDLRRLEVAESRVGAVARAFLETCALVDKGGGEINQEQATVPVNSGPAPRPLARRREDWQIAPRPGTVIHLTMAGEIYQSDLRKLMRQIEAAIEFYPADQPATPDAGADGERETVEAQQAR